MKKKITLFKNIIVSISLVILLIMHLLYGNDSIANNVVDNVIILPICLFFYLLLAYDLFIKMFRHILNKQFFDEITLTLLATIAAFCIGDYVESLAIITFFKWGEFIEDLGYKKSQDSLKDIMSIRPDKVTLYKDGKEEIIDPFSAKEGDIIIVKPGERIPLDGTIISGSSSLDTSSMTGESLPKDVTINDNVISGVINLTSPLIIKSNTTFFNSTVSQVLEMVENATNVKTKEEKFISKFSKYYTPIVVILAFIVSIFPPLIINYSSLEVWSDWIYKGASFLVVSCPCSLVISVPMAYFVSIGHASKYKSLIKGSIYLEKLNKLNKLVLDKTGTITKGNFEIAKIQDFTDKSVLKFAKISEFYSSHPIAIAIKSGTPYIVEESKISDYTLVDGKGVSLLYDGKRLLSGNEKLMEENNISYTKSNDIGTIVYVSYDNQFLGFIVIKDTLKETSQEAIKQFSEYKINDVYMLTGDNQDVANEVASSCNIQHVYSNLLPTDKAKILDTILENKDKKDVVGFVGDGINDAISLKKADIGISMGLIGSQAAIEASDIVIMNDDLSCINKLKKLAKRTIYIVYENMIFSIGIKVLILILTTTGILGQFAMWLAIFGDVGVTLICILNALRINKIKL
ncbi:MAG: heavy metal translocating P-type ATPase [Candidatus Onthovivens sp.]|nr:heavy metal translocating P-type ATPase [Candidatus Onthovivens sp.]